MNNINIFKIGSLVKNNIFKKRFLGVLIIALIFGGLLEIWVTNRLATYGEKIIKIESSIISLEMENEILNMKLSKNTAFLHLEDESDKFGFEQIKNLVYIENADLGSIALNR